jgi:RecA/RadA recombinase
MHTPTPLDDVIATLRHKYGRRIIHSAKQTDDSLQSLATGIDNLDQLLEGGVLHQHINEFTGKPTSGATTCAYHAIASVQEQGYEIVFFDLPQTFDAMVASTCGLMVDKLLLVHPPKLNHALELMRDIALSAVPCLMVLDVSGQQLKKTLSRQQLRLAQSSSLVLLLSRSYTGLADVSLSFERLDWIHSGRDVSGYQIQATLEHHPRLPGRHTQFALPIAWEVDND